MQTTEKVPQISFTVSATFLTRNAVRTLLVCESHLDPNLSFTEDRGLLSSTFHVVMNFPGADPKTVIEAVRKRSGLQIQT